MDAHVSRVARYCMCATEHKLVCSLCDIAALGQDASPHFSCWRQNVRNPTYTLRSISFQLGPRHVWSARHSGVAV